MHFTWKNLTSSLLLVASVVDLRGVHGGRILGSGVNGVPKKSSGHEVVTIQGSKAFATYVCPNNANSVKRQDLGPLIIVPKNQLRDFLRQLRLLELETIALIDSLFTENGTTTVSSRQNTPSPTTLTSRPLASLSSTIDSALAVTMTASPSTCTPAIPTTTTIVTITISPPPITITVTAFPWTTTTTLTSSKRPGMAPYLNTTFRRTTTELVPHNATLSFRPFNTSSRVVSVLSSNVAITTTLDSTTTPSASLSTPSSTTAPTTSSSARSSTSLSSLSPSSVTFSGGIFVETSASPLLSTTSSSLRTGPAVETTSSTSFSSAKTTTQNVPNLSTLTTTTTLSATLTSTPALPTTSISPQFFEQPTNQTDYQFNAASNSNVAVYFGQTPATGGTTMEAQCADPNVDIVILAFVISMTGQYPTVNFGAACGGMTAKMAAEAPGLLSCPGLATSIENCQQKYGKKVLLSIGGATSQFSLATPADASNFANTLWNLFGPPGNIDNDLRPFGTVAIDGFDIDKEDRLPENWDTLALSLRAHYETSTNKTYYLSSAPQCPFPDASNPSGLLLLCDFVFVQFYNNPPCEIGSPGFSASVKQWSESLGASTLAAKPKLYVGAPAFAAAGPSAYANLGGPQGIREVAAEVEQFGLPNFGGVMFWDGPEGMLNMDGGKDIIAYAKEGLMS